MACTPLMQATIQGDIGALRKNLENVRRQDHNGWTALMHAAHEGRMECITLLLTAESGMQDKSGWTALMHAVKNKHLDCLEALLEEALICDYFGRSALILAVQIGFTDAIPHLIQCVTLHLTKPCDDMPIGSTALMFATHLGNVEAIQMLEKYELGLRDNDGHTAFWHMLKSYLTNPLQLDTFLKLISLLHIEDSDIEEVVVQTPLEDIHPLKDSVSSNRDYESIEDLREENLLLISIITGLQGELDTLYNQGSPHSSSHKAERLPP